MLAVAMVIVEGPVMGRLTKRVSTRTLMVVGSLVLAGGLLSFTSSADVAVYGGAILPFRTDLGSATGVMIRAALSEGLGEAPVDIRIMGGTVPISSFINTLGIPAVIVPLVNSDNNQHSPNENLRIGNITSGITTFASILTYRPPD